MKAQLPPQRIATPLEAGVLQNQKTPIRSLLKPLLNLAESSDYLIAGSAGEFAANDGIIFQIPRFIFMGPGGGGDTVRLGIFAAFDGDQHEGSLALAEFLHELELRPQLASGYHIYVYPVCNPTGFVAQTRHNFSGEDLTKHFWQGSSQPEIYYLEREIGVLQFHGVISTYTQNDSENFAGNIDGSAILTRALAKPAIQAAQRFLPGNATKTDAVSTGALPAVAPRDFLTTGRELDPVPFELHLGIPGRVPRPSQIHGTVSALKSVLDSYRSLLSIGQNI
jgi:protein MpaA